MDLTFAICIGLVTFGLACIGYIVSQRKPKNFPPGPWGFPILGHLPLLGLEPHKTAVRWISKYGPIVGVDFGSFPCIIISDYKLAKEAYANPAFCGRPKFDAMARRSGGIPEGVVNSSGVTFREQRKFSVSCLRNLGLGRRSMDDIILHQAQEMVVILRRSLNRSIDTHFTFNIAFWNTLWALILAGEPFSQSDPNLIHYTRLVVDSLEQINVFTMVSMLVPWFGRYFPHWLTKDNYLDTIYSDVYDLFKPYVDEHWATRTPGAPRDYIDAYIDEIESTTASKNTASSFYGSRGRHGLMANLADFFVAGIETTGSTFKWVCLLLANYPDVQEKLAHEIEECIGTERSPSLQDRPFLPYVEAVLAEVMRYRTLVPLSVFHSTTEDVHLGGYDIPADTMVYINVWEAHHNADLWGDPDNFRPERWLSADGTKFVRHDGFMAFSTGKRVCLGEQLARDQLFLFTTCLFQGLRVGFDPSGPRPSMEPMVGSTAACPRPHQLVFSDRNQ